MALFDFFRKKTQEDACAHGAAASVSDAKNARFIVLGACCQKSADTYANVKQATAQLGFTDEVSNIGDAALIAGYGVMQTPALVIGGKVVASGRLLRVAEVKHLIEISGIQP